MIAIQLDLSYLARYLNISTERMQAYRNKSLEEIVELEAEQGNILAQEYLAKTLRDPNSLLKIFNLIDAQNRWMILKEMNEDDLQDLLPLLESKDLISGLFFFTHDALIKMIEEMPPEEITKVLFQCYSEEEFLALVPEPEMNKWFESEKVDKQKVFEQVKGFNQEILAQMVEAVTGENQEDTSHDDLISTIGNFNPREFLEGVQALKPKNKGQIILNMTQEKPALWEEFGAKTLTRPLEYLEKPDIIKGMVKLEDKMLVKMLENLPKELMAVVTTQIDPEIFSKVLARDFQEVLKNVVSI